MLKRNMVCNIIKLVSLLALFNSLNASSTREMIQIRFMNGGHIYVPKNEVSTVQDLDSYIKSQKGILECCPGYEFLRVVPENCP
jgi:hypothetical protein